MQTVRVYKPENNQDYYIADITIELNCASESPFLILNTGMQALDGVLLKNGIKIIVKFFLPKEKQGKMQMEQPQDGVSYRELWIMIMEEP